MVVKPQHLYIEVCFILLLTMIKNIHLASKDVANIFKKEGVPKCISYSFWFITLFTIWVYRKIRGTLNDKKDVDNINRS